MLNELYSLGRTLGEMDIQTKAWHREYKPLPNVSEKSPCFRIWLENSGEIAKIETVSGDLAAVLRKFGDNQASFPAFNLPPLYRITDGRQKNMLERMLANDSCFDLAIVKSWCANDNWLEKTTKKLGRCLGAKPGKLRGLIAKWGDCDNQVTRLMEITGAYSPSNKFRAALETRVFNKLQMRENIKAYLRILIHAGDKNKPAEDDQGSLSVILDLTDWEQYGHPIANEHTTRWINDILLKSDDASEESAGTGGSLDAFGDVYVHVGEPMPEVKLKGFRVKLRAMFREQENQYRYGIIDDESYPIAKNNRAAAKQSLEWISANNKEGYTWRLADKGEIVFVYPSFLQKIPQKFASLFGAPQGGGGRNAERFDAAAREVTKTLRGLPSDKYPDNIRVFSLRKMDQARSKVVFNRNYSTKWLINAAEEWQNGYKNLPDIKIRAFPPKDAASRADDGSHPQMLDPPTLFPLQIPKIINTVWKQNGETKAAAKRMRYHEGMELLLDPAAPETIKNYLNILLSHAAGLMQYAGKMQYAENTQRRGRADSNAKPENIGEVLSVLGLLLYKCGRNKEVYMAGTAYLVGQMLKISDELHAFYCRIKREGDMPPQLAGNSIFAAASETPMPALAQLGRRMNPYIAWAKQYRTKNESDSNRVDRYLRLYEDAATKLHPLLTRGTMRFDDFEKAQMFIGYLAALAEAGETETTKSEPEPPKTAAEGERS
jgi:hypothetical protein